MVIPSPPTRNRLVRVLLLFTLLAVSGVGAFVLWLVRHESRPNDEPRPAAPAASAEPKRAAPRDERPLAARIEAAVAALAQRATWRMAVVDGEGQPVAAPSATTWSRFAPDALPLFEIASRPGELELAAAARWPDLDRLQVGAPGMAPRTVLPLVLPAGGGLLDPLRLATGATLRGRVVDGGDAPLAGRTVTLWELGAPPLDRADGRAAPIARTTSDADGAFTFEHVATKTVRCEAAGGGGLANGVVDEAVAGERPFTLRLATVDLPIEGSVVDEAGRPIAGATVVATQVGARERAFDAACSDADGRFTLALLPRGYDVVEARAPGFAAATLRRAHTGTRGVTIVLTALATAEVELLGGPRTGVVPLLWRTLASSGKYRRPTSPFAAGELRDGKAVLPRVPTGRHAFELRVPGAAPIETPAVELAPGLATLLGTFELRAGATVRARLRGPDGKARAGRAALAAAFQADLVAKRDLFLFDDRDERSIGDDGALEWSALPPGPRTLAFRSPGCADRVVTLVVPEEGEVDLGDVALDAAGAIEGVVRRFSGVPLGDATLLAERVGGMQQQATTTADGRYRFDRLAPGRWEVRLLPIDDPSDPVFDPSGARGELPPALLDVLPGKTVSRDFQLDR